MTPVRPTLFEFAGGEAALLALARAHHARCLADPELNHPFSRDGQHPQHVERLAAYWGEVLGGPATYSQDCGTESGVLELHSATATWEISVHDSSTASSRRSTTPALPADAEFRASMRAYMEWAVSNVLSYSAEDTVVPAGVGMPRWDWGGLQ